MGWGLLFEDFSMIFRRCFDDLFDVFLKKEQEGFATFCFPDHCEGGLVQKMWVGDYFSIIFR